MKRETVLRLLKRALPDPPWSEDKLQSSLETLQRIAEYKLNSYEMYAPGRFFLENLAQWLERLPVSDRTLAMDFVQNRLQFISRSEFQQLSQVLYHDKIRQVQLDLTSQSTGIPRYMVAALAKHQRMSDVKRGTLYVGLSDGARIDYFRRQNLDINNEQVIAHYSAGPNKGDELKKQLSAHTGGRLKGYVCLVLLDDFCGSGRTDLREIIALDLPVAVGDLKVPPSLLAKASIDDDERKLVWNWRSPIRPDEIASLESMSTAKEFRLVVADLVQKAKDRETTLKGAFVKLQKAGWFSSLSENAAALFCPLLTTEYAINRLSPLINRLAQPPLNKMKILPAATIGDEFRIKDDGSPLAAFTKRHYDPRIEDEHTGNVEFGYDDCGLPLVLHHNTPNNSMYWLWARDWKSPLFPRYERHGRERAR